MAGKLSVVIITFNEEKNIDRCLDAAWQVADEIVVVDSYSTDKTKQICEERGVKFFENKFEGYGAQKNFANSKATNDLILSLDADEVLSNELISSIQKVKKNTVYDAYYINRLSFYVDRFIKHGHWFPDKKLRLFRKSAGAWSLDEVHELYQLNRGKISSSLNGVIYHYTFNSIEEHLNQANKFSEIGARQLTNDNIVFLVTKAIFSPIWGFIYGYFFRFGFLDGWYGLIIAVISSNESFLKYAKAILARASKKENAKNCETDCSISLIISTYNWPEALKLSLESVKLQSLLPNEVIIADDGSTDETRVLIEKLREDFPVPLHHSWIEDKGFRLAKSRNEALKKAKYDYILQIDGDIILHKHFVADHASFAQKGSFVRGSRVLLNKKISKKIFAGKIKMPNILLRGTTNFFNGLRIPPFQKIFNIKSKSISGIRGCNMAYWRLDALAVNGYNESIQGWGREDSEFVARLINIGVYKRILRLGGIQYHLYHKEYDRKLLSKNDDILNKTIEEKLVRCEFGIKHLSQPNERLIPVDK